MSEQEIPESYTPTGEIKVKPRSKILGVAKIITINGVEYIQDVNGKLILYNQPIVVR